MTTSFLIRLGVAGAAALALSGCALLSTPDPVQTYRFGGAAATQGSAAITEPVQVSFRRIEMPAAVQNDRILSVTGAETAYIGGARWVSPASELYTAALENAFVTQATQVRLIGPRELTRSTRALDVDVRAFEARYDAPGATPTVVITIRARVLTLPERSVRAERIFTVEQTAGANRVSAIVEAFDLATRDINTQIVAWTEASVG
ncbi:MAG TPA: ABC-type transport auxiliary lipoprotein family protein [Brevundimonas sp.]|nr:ABC-type transport auxiliary lipoprotein family protein [Brevundimonas sp.]